MTTRACLLCRFNLDELRQACGDVTADIEMKTLQQSACQFVDSLAKSNQNLDQVSDTERINDEDEEIVSEEELEELCEFMMTQRDQNFDTRETQSAAVDKNSRSGKEDSSESEGEEDDVVHLSQALLRKLEESFAAELMPDESRISPRAVEEEANTAICDKLNDSLISVHDSDRMMSAELNSSDMEVSISEDDCVDSQKTFSSVQKDSAICTTSKDSLTSISAGKSACLMLAEQADQNAEMNDVNSLDEEMPASDTDVKDSGSVTRPLPSADVHEVEMSADDAVRDKPVSPEPAAVVIQSSCSAASPVCMFEESSLDQCDLEQLNCSADKSAAADDNSRLSDLDLIDVTELIDRCESSDDLFDSPTSNKCAASPAACLRAQSETLSEQDDQTLQSVSTGNRQVQLDDVACHDSQTQSSHKSESSAVEDLQRKFEALPEQDSEMILSSQKASFPAQENLETCSEVLAKEATSSASVTAVTEVEEADIQVEEHLSYKSNSSDSALMAVGLSAGHRQSDSSDDDITPKCRGLRKVRAKTRNSLTSDDTCLLQYSSSFPQTSCSRGNRTSRSVDSDIEPHSDDDVIENQTVGLEKSHVSHLAYPHNRSPLVESTKKCYVKLARISDADFPPQVHLIKV